MDIDALVSGTIAIVGAAVGAFYGARLRDESKRREGAIAALPKYYASAATAWYVNGEYERCDEASAAYPAIEKHFWDSYYAMLAANTELATRLSEPLRTRVLELENLWEKLGPEDEDKWFEYLDEIRDEVLRSGELELT